MAGDAVPEVFSGATADAEDLVELRVLQLMHLLPRAHVDVAHQLALERGFPQGLDADLTVLELAV